MWKENWPELQSRFDSFWDRNGFILSMWNGYLPITRQTCVSPEIDLKETAAKIEQIRKGGNWEEFYTDPHLVAAQQRYAICHGIYPGDLVPFSYCDWGTLTLAPMLGANQHFNEETVWYTKPANPISPDNNSELILDDDNEWFLKLQDLARIGTEYAQGKYLCGTPATCGGLDVLSELRGASDLCVDLVFEPKWVKEKIKEIDLVSRKAFNTIYEIMKDEEGAMFHAFFMIWGRGKTSLIQCDFATLISEDYFREFQIPSIVDACSYLDYSLYHVDGPDALRTIDALLEVEKLDCIEFTPGPQVPQGGNPKWYPLYRKIIEAGKCVQVVEMQADEVEPLLNAIGTKGVYMMVNFQSEEELFEIIRISQKYR